MVHQGKLISFGLVNALLVCVIVFLTPVVILCAICCPSTQPMQFAQIVLHQFGLGLFMYGMIPLGLMIHVILTRPTVLEFNDRTILQRYAFWSVSLDMDRIAWIGTTWDNNLLVFGPGAILRWPIPKRGRCPAFEDLVYRAKRSCLEQHYQPVALTASTRRALPLITFCVSSKWLVCIGYTCCALFILFTTFGIWIGAVAVWCILSTAPGWMMLPQLALQRVIPKLGDDWEHLGPLLTWSSGSPDRSKMAKIILRYMYNNLEEISISSSVLRIVNSWLVHGFDSLLIEDILPVIPRIGNCVTLKRLKRLRELSTVRGSKSLLPTQELTICINELSNALAAGYR